MGHAAVSTTVIRARNHQIDVNTPHLRYHRERTRRGSRSFALRLGRALPLRWMSASDVLQAISVIIAVGVIWLALYYTR